MSSRVHAVTFDCRNAAGLAAFWAGALGGRILDGAAEQWAMLEGPAGVGHLLFLQVPAAKGTKNRCHVDLATDDPAAEVERLVGLGATVVHEKDEWGVHWFTLQDPEGNEFCVAGHPPAGEPA